MDELDLILNEIEEEESKIYIKEITEKCLKILKNSIDTYVYAFYDPVLYNRTEQLKDNLKVEINNDVIEIIWKDVDYYSNNNYYLNDCSVPYWVNYGHNNKNGNVQNYDIYEGRYFLEKAKEEIEKQLGIECEIIKEL